jgi:hypothetical protein
MVLTGLTRAWRREPRSPVEVALRTSSSTLVMTLLTLSACRKIESSGVVCGYAEDGKAIDTRGRTDGVYAVRDDQLAPAPLVTFDRMTKTGEGLEPGSGKRWFAIHLGEAESRALRDFSSEPGERKQLAVVAGGEIASIHKVKQAITGSDARVSCCNAQACDRWSASLTGAK